MIECCDCHKELHYECSQCCGSLCEDCALFCGVCEESLCNRCHEYYNEQTLCPDCYDDILAEEEEEL